MQGMGTPDGVLAALRAAPDTALGLLDRAVLGAGRKTAKEAGSGSSAGPERPAEVTGIVSGRDGCVVGVRDSAPPLRGLQLHTLAERAWYVCTACGRAARKSVVATHEVPAGTDALVCPACYRRFTGG